MLNLFCSYLRKALLPTLPKNNQLWENWIVKSSHYLGKPNLWSNETSLILRIKYPIYVFCQQYLQSLSKSWNLHCSIRFLILFQRPFDLIHLAQIHWVTERCLRQIGLTEVHDQAWHQVPPPCPNSNHAAEVPRQENSVLLSRLYHCRN